MTPVRIDIQAANRHTYPVLLAYGLLANLTQTLDALDVGRRRIAISTLPIWRFVGDRLRTQIAAPEPVLMPDGERFKHLGTVTRLYEGLVRAAAERSSVVLAVGGGVVGDTAGFAAATFLRGLPLVQVPTTLLAQVDSAIGGKVGVNLPAGKNLVGAFHPPVAVVVDPSVLETLPRREFRAGLYEVVKYAMIASPSLFATLSTNLAAVFAKQPDVLVPVIAECCAIKGRIVSEDEHERGLRRTLNYGHTAGHALEAVTRYRRFRHGEAVGYGMLVAGHIGRARGVFADEAFAALSALIASLGPLPPVADLSMAEALGAMRRDKKVIDGRVHFVLPSRIGETVIVNDVSEAELSAALEALGMRH
jgi:3-dehydroquinate synthase